MYANILYNKRKKSHTERGEIGNIIVDIFDGEGEDLDTHSADVRGRNLADQGGELVPIFVDLLDGQCAWKRKKNN
jgi:hypothetical protein